MTQEADLPDPSRGTVDGGLLHDVLMSQFLFTFASR